MFFNAKKRKYSKFSRKNDRKSFPSAFRENTLEIRIQRVELRKENLAVAVELYRLRMPFRNTHTLRSKKSVKVKTENEILFGNEHYNFPF